MPVTQPSTPGTSSIRYRNYCGDRDDLNDINIIGPYPSAGARDGDLARLDALPGTYGNAEFEASAISPEAADRSATPDQVGHASTHQEFFSAFFNLDDLDLMDDDR